MIVNHRHSSQNRRRRAPQTWHERIGACYTCCCCCCCCYCDLCCDSYCRCCCYYYCLLCSESVARILVRYPPYRDVSRAGRSCTIAEHHYRTWKSQTLYRAIPMWLLGTIAGSDGRLLGPPNGASELRETV
ncbi:unnamed protein product [Laminaria digitata]